MKVKIIEYNNLNGSIWLQVSTSVSHTWDFVPSFHRFPENYFKFRDHENVGEGHDV